MKLGKQAYRTGNINPKVIDKLIERNLDIKFKNKSAADILNEVLKDEQS